MHSVTRLGPAAAITAAFLLSTVSVHAEPKTTPPPTASPLKSQEGKLDLEKGRIGELKVATQPINVDSEVARIKKQLHQIQKSTIARERKIQLQQRLIDDEIALVEKQMREIDADESNDLKGQGAARDRRKAGRATLQEFLDMIRSLSTDLW